MFMENHDIQEGSIISRKRPSHLKTGRGSPAVEELDWNIIVGASINDPTYVIYVSVVPNATP
jgi:hypothetical protein